MKYIKHLLVLFLVSIVTVSCDDEEVSYALDDLSAPTDVNAKFDISQDEKGLVTVMPTANGATQFEVYFGDETNETPTILNPGETATHTYAEGEFNLRIVAIGLTGLKSELVRVVTISMDAPEDLNVDVAISGTNPYEVMVTPTATNATVYDVYFGDMEDEEPTTIMNGETATHIYAEVGDYTVRVVARGAGTATLEYTEEISITGASNAMKFPITFDDATVNYEFVTFDGASFEVVTNPDLSGANTAETKVGAITNSGVAYEGGSFELGTPVDFSGDNKTITIKFWSQKEVSVLMKFEGGVNDERQNEVVATHGGTGWEVMTFNFATSATKSYIDGNQGVGEAFVPTGQYSILTLFVDGGGTMDGTFYIDDIMKAAVDNGDPLKLPLDFDGDLAYAAATTGTTFEVVTNPNQSGINNSDTKVGKVTNNGEQYEALTVQLDEAIDFSSASKTITMKVYSMTAYPVLFKLEAGVNGERANEVEVNHGGTGWEELTFDFATNARKSFVNGDGENGAPFVPTGKYDSFSIFLDFAGTTAGDFYIDDIELNGNGNGGTDGGETSKEPTTAAPTPSAASANVRSIFSDAYGDPSAVNYYPDWGQSTQYEMVSPGGNAAIKYSDVNYQGIDLGEEIDVTGFDKVHIDVWSGDYTSIDFYLISKASGEQKVALNVAPNKWNSLEISLKDFTDQNLSLNDIFQFKFDVQPEVGGTFFIDNLYFSKSGTTTGGGTDNGGETPSGTAPYSPINFEAGGYGANFTWSVFENAGNPALEIVDNPSKTGINTSSKVAKFTALKDGQPYAGVESKRNADLGDFKFDASNKIVKVMVYKTTISNVGLKFSEANGEAQQEILVPNTKINEWEELTFDLSGSIGAGVTGVITQIIIFPDFQDRDADNVVYFDNITFGSN